MRYLTVMLLLISACTAPPATQSPDDVVTLDAAPDAATFDTVADVPPPADVTAAVDVTKTTDAAPDIADVPDIQPDVDTADTSAIGPPPGPAVSPPPDATWTVTGDCVTPEPVATPACVTVKCTKGNVCMGDGKCTPAEPFGIVTSIPTQVAPALASRPDGAWALAWYDGTMDSEMHVYVQVAVGGGGVLSAPLQVDDPGAHWAFAPSLVALADGTWLVVWRDEQFFKGTVQFFGRRISTDGTFLLAPQFEITNGPQWAGGGSTNVVNPLAVRLRDQNVLVAWPAASQPGTLLSVHARRLDLNGVPIGPELDTGSGGPGVESYSPAIAPLPDGACLLAWQSWSNKGHVQVYGRRFASDGTPQGDVVPLSAGQKAYEALPAAASFPDGGVFLAWKEGDITTSTTPVAIAGKAWSPTLLPQNAGLYQAVAADKDGSYPDQPPVASLPTERVAIVWHSIAADGGLFLRRYYRAPDRLDCETTDVAGPKSLPGEGVRYLPAVEGLPDGRVVVAWNVDLSGLPRVMIKILGW